MPVGWAATDRRRVSGLIALRTYRALARVSGRAQKGERVAYLFEVIATAGIEHNEDIRTFRARALEYRVAERPNGRQPAEKVRRVRLVLDGRRGTRG